MWYENTNSMGIMKRKYLHEGEKPEDFIPRVASIFEGDLKRKAIEVLSNADFLPAGRTLFGAGYKGSRKVSLSNCYCLPSVEDTIESIFETATMIARISSYGGGCGVAIDKLRPKDAPVNNSAIKSTGAVSFLNIFDATGSTIGQNGRRAALMICLRCDHPDIEEFLNIKNEGNKLPSMNISIKFTNEFMEAVRDNKQFRLHFESPETGLIERYINAKEFFERFCLSNWRWGDPGVSFTDRVRSFQLLSGYPEYVIDISNPCLAGYTRILTDQGYFPIETLVGKEVNIWNGYRYSTVVPRITGYNQKMLRVTFSNGSHVDCTVYHKLIMNDGSRKEAKDLQVGDKLPKWKLIPIEGPRNVDRKIMYTHGFFSGDGYINSSTNTPFITLYGSKKNLLEAMNYDIYHEQNTTNKSGDTRVNVKLKVDDQIPYFKNWVPDASYSIDSRLWWLAGLIDSDGTMNSEEGSIAISSIDCDFLHNVQLLLNTLGIHSSIGLYRKAGMRELPANNGTGENKEYYCQDCYRLVISAYNVLQLSRLNMTILRVPCLPMPNRDAGRFINVVSVEPIPDAPIVYCLNEPYNHSFIAEGLLVGNCSEVHANGGNSCNLGSINLYNVIDDKFTDNAHVNVSKLQHITDVGVRMLDSILDYGYDMQPLEINKKCVREWRAIGLGVFGLADAFVALGIRYGSQKSREMVSLIMDNILKQALITSSLLAKEKGTFEKFDIDKTMKSPLIQAYPELHDMIRENGLRNGSLISVAPTGTISLFAGGFTGGVEPMFKIAYTRSSHNMEEKGKTFTIYSRGVADLLKFHNMEGLDVEEAKKKFPFLIESHEVPYLERVHLQSVMQDYVDNAISSTVNLPNSATVEDIKNIYMEAWKAGLKGITVFRDGCERGNILGVDTKKKDEVVYDSIDPETRRGVKKIDGTTVRECTSCVKSLYVTVNKLENGKAFEVFTNASGGCKTNINTLSRLISLALRSGVKASRIIDELRANQCPACQLLRRQGNEEIALSCSNAIADAIELALEVEDKKEDNDDAVIKRPCPSCGKKTLIPEGKCVTCSNCGWSKCE